MLPRRPNSGEHGTGVGQGGGDTEHGDHVQRAGVHRRAGRGSTRTAPGLALPQHVGEGLSFYAKGEQEYDEA